ncbi:MAG: replication initiator protein A [Lachnospiraceae bacterium]|nr:replication initiator protein A [Lachnospiraceae bacterium]
MSKYMYEHTKMPSYLPMPRFLLNCPISNTAKMLYIRLLSKAQLSQKNRWLDGQGRVYFIYPIHQMAADMNKSETTIKDAMKELVKAQLLEKIPEGRGRPNRLYILFPNEEQGQKSAVGNPTAVGQKSVSNHGGNPSPSKYISNNRNNHLRDYNYEEEESF